MSSAPEQFNQPLSQPMEKILLAAKDDGRINTGYISNILERNFIEESRQIALARFLIHQGFQDIIPEVLSHFANDQIRREISNLIRPNDPKPKNIGPEVERIKMLIEDPESLNTETLKEVLTSPFFPKELHEHLKKKLLSKKRWQLVLSNLFHFQGINYMETLLEINIMLGTNPWPEEFLAGIPQELRKPFALQLIKQDQGYKVARQFDLFYMASRDIAYELARKDPFSLCRYIEKFCFGFQVDQKEICEYLIVKTEEGAQAVAEHASQFTNLTSDKIGEMLCQKGKRHLVERNIKEFKNLSDEFRRRWRIFSQVKPNSDEFV